MIVITVKRVLVKENSREVWQAVQLATRVS